MTTTENSDNTNRSLHSSTIRISIDDVIKMLDVPSSGRDLIQEINVAYLVNRAPIAHLSIERVMKFLIHSAGASFEKRHHLHTLLDSLAKHDPNAADFLNRAFTDAVEFYQLNPNVPEYRHLKDLKEYLSLVGTESMFKLMRYWEIEQDMDSETIRKLNRVSLRLHREILCALRGLLVSRKHSMTVSERVEAQLRHTFTNPTNLGYVSGTPKETYVKRYIKWLISYKTVREAVTAAKSNGFDIGHDMASAIARKQYETLKDTNDPAIQHLLQIMDVLPKQQREFLPTVDWIISDQYGIVKSPAGTSLGEIERRPDRLWAITPHTSGLIYASALARTQTDARGYLADQLSVPLEVSSDGNTRTHQIVAQEPLMLFSVDQRFISEPDDIIGRDNKELTLEFWSSDHGLQCGADVEVVYYQDPSSPLAEVLEGVVARIDKHEVTIIGNTVIDLRPQ